MSTAQAIAVASYKNMVPAECDRLYFERFIGKLAGDDVGRITYKEAIYYYKDALEAGKTPKSVANELGCNLTTVHAWAKAYGFKLPEHRKDEIRSALHRSLTIAEAAAKLGVSATTLSTHCNKIGIRQRRPAASDAAPGEPGLRPAWNGNFRRILAPISAAETRKMVDDAIAAGRLTKLPPGFAMGSMNMCWERIL